MSLKTTIFKEEMSRYTFNMTAGTFGRILLLGAMVGLFAWALSLAMDRYVLTPLFCNSDSGVSVCMNSAVIGANISTVLMGIMVVPMLAALRVKRSLLVAVAAVVSLWGIAAWVANPWYVSLLWTMGVYAIVYAALAWINRLRGDAAVIVFIILFAILARIISLVS